MNLDKQRFNQKFKVTEQQSKIDAIEADLFNRKNQTIAENNQEINKKNIQLYNEALKYNREQKQKINNLNTQTNINKYNQLLKNEIETLKDAYGIQLNRDKYFLDRMYKLNQDLQRV